MRLLAVYIPFLIVLLVVSGCGFSLGGADPYVKTYYHAEITSHTKMDWDIRLKVNDDSVRSGSLELWIRYPEKLSVDTLYYTRFFAPPKDTSIEDSTMEPWERDYRASMYQQGDVENIKTYLNEEVDGKKRYELIPDSNGHVVFSFFDKDSVEKKYDIDVSGFIKFLEHPYELRGDSVDVYIPEGITSLSYYGVCTCAECGSSYCFNSIIADSLENRTYSTDIADLWGRWGQIELGTLLKNQSSLKTDDISIILQYRLVY